MPFAISGRIIELESKRPIPGLIVRAVDQDEQFAHLLVATVTDGDGLFRMEYREARTAALFAARPRIFLRVYAPPWQFLVESSPPVPWVDGAEPRIDLKIRRASLGAFSPGRPDGFVEGGVYLDSNALVIEKQGVFDLPSLRGFKQGGPVGGPTMPEQIQTVVLPGGAKNLRLEVRPGRPVRLPGPVHPFPVQPPPPEPGSASPRPAPLTQLYPRFAQRAGLLPKDVVILGKPKPYHFMQVATVRVRPVQYDPVAHAYIFYPGLRYRVHYDAPPGTSTPRRFSEPQLAQMQQFIDRANVFVAKDIGAGLSEMGTGWFHAPAMPDVDYLIVASNYAWPERIRLAGVNLAMHGGIPDTLPPMYRPPHADEYIKVLGADGNGNGAGPVTHFWRLAKWKTERGVRTMVVTIEQILGGEFGDLTTVDGVRARDLQEVIRNFLKHVHRESPFSYLLLGGSRQVVPMRSLLAYVTCEGAYPAWDFSGGDAVPAAFAAATPPPRCCAVDPDDPHKVRLCHDSVLGIPDKHTVLSTGQGKALPFKAQPGDGKAGWYFTQTDFSGCCEAPVWYPYVPQPSFDETGNGVNICNLIVEGPDWAVDDHYYWAFAPERLIPSDLYYACLTTGTDSPSNANGHDWDLNGNYLYGQFRWDAAEGTEVTIDSTAPNLPDVWVGRAPVERGSEAGAFVDKVLTYERLRTPTGLAVDPDYLTRVVLAGDVMNGPAHVAEQLPHLTNSGTPAAGTFVHHADESSILVHLQPELVDKFNTSDGMRRHLLARYHWSNHLGTDMPVLPRLPGQHGWQFVTQARSGAFVPSAGPSAFVKISGSPYNIKPQKLLWRFGAGETNDNGAAGCEELLANVLAPSFRAFDKIVRHYVEFLNFDPPVFDLTPTLIRAQLDLGCHFLVLHGHGGFNGVSMVWWYEIPGCRPEFRNRDRYFIAYGQSCYTAQPDYMRAGERIRSLGEVMVLHPEGGAVAYIGYTRIGVSGGKRQQEIFWRNVKLFGRLGRAAGTPYSDTDDLDDLYQYYNQILYGDPNMPVWLQVPRRYAVVYPGVIDLSQNSVRITVLDDGHCVKNQRVTLLGGWHEEVRKPAYFKTKVTGDGGTATFNVSDVPDEVTELTLTVTCWPTGTNYIPFQTTLPVVRD